VQPEGRFLEVMAGALEVNLDEFGRMSLKADLPARISSLCTVFAESEIISLIAKEKNGKISLPGIHESICVRVLGHGEPYRYQVPGHDDGRCGKKHWRPSGLLKKPLALHRGFRLRPGERSDWRRLAGTGSLNHTKKLWRFS